METPVAVTDVEKKSLFWATITRDLGFPIIVAFLLGFALWTVGQQHFSMMQSHLTEVTTVMKGFQDNHAKSILIQEKILWRLDQLEKK